MYPDHSVNSITNINSLLEHVQKFPVKSAEYTYYKRGIWVYFFLLIFEGALRKWILPELAAPLLIVRDPVALILVLAAWRKGLLPHSLILTGMALVGVISFFTAFYLGHGSATVAFFGARIFLIQFPLIYVIATVFSTDDVVYMGKIMLWLSLPMTVLIILQFYSPQSAWVNRGVGGDLKGAGFSGALGYFRPPGTFSFTTGVAQFYGLMAAYIFYFWLTPKIVNRLLLVAATVCLLAAVPLSISRSLFFSVLFSIGFAGIILLRRPKHLMKGIMAALIIGLLLSALGSSFIFQDATKAFSARFESASKSEKGIQGTLVDRYLGGMVGALENSSQQPFWGYGSGMGTNAGATLLTGKQDFLIAEGEWGRLIGELGPLMGIFVIFLRISFSASLTVRSYRKIKVGDLLPWMLLSFGLLQIPQGQWAQPTSLGFSILVGGMVLAALNGTAAQGAITKQL